MAHIEALHTKLQLGSGAVGLAPHPPPGALPPSVHPPKIQKSAPGAVGVLTTIEYGSNGQEVLMQYPSPDSTHLPTRAICPHCQAFVTTSTRSQSGVVTHFSAIILFFLGCCLIPYCCDGFKDTVHQCPNCEKTIAVAQREMTY